MSKRRDLYSNGPCEGDLDLGAIRNALPVGSYTDDELHLEEYVEFDDPEMPDGYPDYMRAILIVGKCSADHLAILIKSGLVGNREDYKLDQDRYGSYNVSLLEHVMPDVEKMRVCLQLGDFNIHTSELLNDGRRECFDHGDGHDKLCVYFCQGGESIDGLKLLLAHCDYNPVYEATLSAARDCKSRAPDTFAALEELTYARRFGTAETPVGFARISRVLAMERTNAAMKMAFLLWLERSGTFAPGGMGQKRDRRAFETDFA